MSAPAESQPVARAGPCVITADLAAEDRRFRAALSSERKTTIARQLGVSLVALDSIGMGSADYDDLKGLRAGGDGWKGDCPRVVSSFPECDATGRRRHLLPG